MSPLLRSLLALAVSLAVWAAVQLADLWQREGR